jgi:ATP-dependent DNA ligase
VLDGEIVIPHEDRLSFEQLLQRIHPAASRVNRLAAETPGLFVAFDILLANRGAALTGEPFQVRRDRLEAFAGRYFGGRVRLSPHTADAAEARRWLGSGTDGLDGVMAKRLDAPYLTGERKGMAKIKRLRTADCVVAGYRKASKGKADRFAAARACSATTACCITWAIRPASRRHRRPRCWRNWNRWPAAPASPATRPGGPSRWNKRDSDDWVPLDHRLVAEVRYDHFSEGRFRHATRFERWRPDKDPAQCTFHQIEREGRSTLAMLDDPG